MPCSKCPGAWHANANGPVPLNVKVSSPGCPGPMSATSGVPSLSANASASCPIMNSWVALPVLFTWNFTVSPIAAWMSPGVKVRLSSVVALMTRGLASVPGVKPIVGSGACVTTGLGAAVGADDTAAVARVGAPEIPGSYVQDGLGEALPQPARIMAAAMAAPNHRDGKRRCASIALFRSEPAWRGSPADRQILWRRCGDASGQVALLGRTERPEYRHGPISRMGQGSVPKQYPSEQPAAVIAPIARSASPDFRSTAAIASWRTSVSKPRLAASMAVEVTQASVARA